MSWIKVEKEIGTDTKIDKSTGTDTKIEKETGVDTKIVKVEEQECRDMSWAEFGEVVWADKEWTWADLMICLALWTKILKEIANWEKVTR